MDEILLETTGASEFLLETKGVTIAPMTLAIWRHQKMGPPYHKLGRKVYYSPAGLAQWIDDQMVEGRPLRAQPQRRARP